MDTNVKLILFSLTISLYVSSVFSQEKDWRDINNAISTIPGEAYCDQPYLIKNKHGEWLCVLTTGAEREGSSQQHIISAISKDKGKTWTHISNIEPASGGNEASWAIPFIVPSGRIYVLYTYNADNIRVVDGCDGSKIKRVDSLGKMMMKYSDDGGHTWSNMRYEVPIRNFEIDERNVYNGKLQFFWSISKPVIMDNAVYLGVSKIGNFTTFGFMHSTEGCFLKSDNILYEKEPGKIRWHTLPDGKIGLRAPEGLIADEHNIVKLTDGSLYCIFRTQRGYAAQSYSRDGGHTWSVPQWAEYTPGGQKIKQPRCLIKVSQFENGKYLLFFHNNGARDTGGWPLGNRNPTWLSAGIEKDGYIHWSHPEIFLYDNNFTKGISYPDWLEDDGKYYFSETQKSTARLHQIPSEFLHMLWAQFSVKKVTKKQLSLDLKRTDCAAGKTFTMPTLPSLYNGGGFSLDLWIETGKTDEEQVILDTRHRHTIGEYKAATFKGVGLEIKTLPKGAIQILLDDSRSPLIWDSGEGSIQANSRHHIVISVDGSSRILTFVVDGKLSDGGERPFGFARLNPYLSDVNGQKAVAFSKSFNGSVFNFRVYNRSIHTTEAIGNYREGIERNALHDNIREKTAI